MADGANPADTRHQRGHFMERAAFAKFFEAAYLRHVKMRILDLSGIVQLDRNLGVTFYACYRVNNNLTAHMIYFLIF